MQELNGDIQGRCNKEKTTCCWLNLPTNFDPDKHKIVMIDSMTEQVICRITGEKPTKRKYHNEYCLYLQYMQSISCTTPLIYEQWEEDWMSNNPVRKQAILRAYSEALGYKVKPISLQENSDAFCFNLYVNPKDV